MSEPTVKRGRGRPRTEEVVERMLNAAKPETIDDGKKSSHDARQHYGRILEYVMLNMKSAALMGNYLGWYRCLREFHIMVLGYVKKEKLDGIKEKFNKAKIALDGYENMTAYRDRAVQNAVMIRVSSMDELFFEIEEQLHLASRDLMLPTKEDDILEFDEEKFLRDSDL